MRPVVWICLLVLLASCKASGPSLFGNRSLHAQYGEQLEKAGLKNSSFGAAWFRAADAVLSNPVNINIPFKEQGYFAAELPKAVGLRFTARRGERLSITVNKKSVTPFALYVELWRSPSPNTSLKLLESMDTAQSSFTYDVEEDQSFILRIQPELGISGEYTVTIQNGPSLAFPVQVNKQVISSFWGADRDGGSRRHEGVDIFAPKGTPLLAAADGIITRVEETNIGGKVVWMRPEGKNYTLYYAHLDEQLAEQGRKVRSGDVIGKVGNTGNAMTTGPHLHFGIYAQGGAIDPLLFIQPSQKNVPAITADINNIGTTMKTASTVKAFIAPGTTAVSINLEKNIPLKIDAANASWYKVITPDEKILFIPAAQTQKLVAIQTVKTMASQPLYDQPSVNAARKMMIEKGETIEVLAKYSNFSYIQYKSTFGWITGI